MIKIAIVDDNQFYINDIKKLLSENIENIAYDVIEYLTCDAFTDVLNTEKFDIIFLDIVLDKEDGIKLGLKINESQPNANIIFVSSHSEYFKDVYKVSHSYFLTKEFEKERFADALSKALKNIQRTTITIHTKNDNCKIVLNDVMCFEGFLKHTKVFMTNGSVTEYNVNIKDIERLLPNDTFVRTHQSFIINMNYIKKYNRQTIFMNCDNVIPISRTYINPVREKITLFLGGAI